MYLVQLLVLRLFLFCRNSGWQWGKGKKRFFINVFWTLMPIGVCRCHYTLHFCFSSYKNYCSWFWCYYSEFVSRYFPFGIYHQRDSCSYIIHTIFKLEKCFYLPMFAASIGTLVLVGYLIIAGTSANVHFWFQYLLLLTILLQQKSWDTTILMPGTRI